MDNGTFNGVIEEQVDRSVSLLMNKNANYNDGSDKLRNFRVAADLKKTTMRAALSGMMSKHTVSIYDMCESGTSYSEEVWNEKITDHINYLLLLAAVIRDDEGAISLSDAQLADIREQLTGDNYATITTHEGSMS